MKIFPKVGFCHCFHYQCSSKVKITNWQQWDQTLQQGALKTSYKRVEGNNIEKPEWIDSHHLSRIVSPMSLECGRILQILYFPFVVKSFVLYCVVKSFTPCFSQGLKSHQRVWWTLKVMNKISWNSHLKLHTYGWKLNNFKM